MDFDVSSSSSEKERKFQGSKSIPQHGKVDKLSLCESLQTLHSISYIEPMVKQFLGLGISVMLFYLIPMYSKCFCDSKNLQYV